MCKQPYIDLFVCTNETNWPESNHANVYLYDWRYLCKIFYDIDRKLIFSLDNQNIWNYVLS